MKDSSSFEFYYESLNPQQKMAVDAVEGPVLVVAGPGSGKTQLLSMRVANILAQTDAIASSVLCLTFTDSAAVNMRERLVKIIGKEAYKVAIYTFHSFGADIINQNPEYFFFGAGYKPADDLARIALIQSILESLPRSNPLASYSPDHGWVYAGSILSRIGDLKKAGLSPVAYQKVIQQNRIFLTQVQPYIQTFFAQDKKTQIAGLSQLIEDIQSFPSSTNQENQNLSYSLKQIYLEALSQAYLEMVEIEKISSKTKPVTAWRKKFTREDKEKKPVLKDYMDIEKHLALAEVYEKYQSSLHQQALFDFDDMLLEVVEKLKQNADLRYTYQERYQYILVDEFQDTSGVQTELLNQLVNMELSEGRPNIMAVGDDDQSIFKFQGASLENILQFQEKYRDVQTITLTDNYRSRQDILDFAMDVIAMAQQRLDGRDNINKKLISRVSH